MASPAPWTDTLPPTSLAQASPPIGTDPRSRKNLLRTQSMSNLRLKTELVLESVPSDTKKDMDMDRNESIRFLGFLATGSISRSRKSLTRSRSMPELRRVKTKGARDEGYWRNVLWEYLRAMRRFPLDKTIFSKDNIIDRNVARTKDGYVVKSTSGQIGYEFEAMRYVHKHSAIPMAVPLAMVAWNGYEYMLMTYVPGQTLKCAINDTSWGHIEAIKSMLPKYVRLLHSIPLPQNLDPEPFNGLWDFRGYPRYETTLVSTLDCRPLSPITYLTILLILHARAKGLDDPVITNVITHGHLHPENIIVDGTRISGIIDWEYLRIAPMWWEMASIWYRYGRSTRFEYYIPIYHDKQYIEPFTRPAGYESPHFMINIWHNHLDLMKTLQVFSTSHRPMLIQ